MTFERLINTTPDRATILIRLVVGGIFLSEGIQKFLFPASLGTGRFERIGFPHPAFFANFVGVFEIICGVLILIGFITRLAALVMIINIMVAILVTKFPILIGRGFGPFAVRDLKSYGFWAMAHEARTDFSMLLGSLFLLIKGAGKYSVDHILNFEKEQREN